MIFWCPWKKWTTFLVESTSPNGGLTNWKTKHDLEIPWTIHIYKMVQNNNMFGKKMLCVDFLLGQGFERKWRETVAFALPIYYQMGCFPQEDYQIWQLLDFHQQTWLLTLVFTFDFYSTTSTTAENTYSAHPNFTVIQWTESQYCNCVSTLNIQLQVHLVFRRLSQWLPPKAQDVITMFQCFHPGFL